MKANNLAFTLPFPENPNMCGRLFIKPVTSLEQLLEMFGLLNIVLPILNNVAPTETIPVIHATTSGALALTPMRWWLHPSWSKDPPNQKYETFNARIETVATAPSFRGPIKHRRAIIPAAGFVEWKREGKVKTPFYIDAHDKPLLLAAVWDTWQDQLHSCAVITQPANPEFLTVHDRMPVSLDAEQARRWLDPAEDAKELLTQFAGASAKLRMQPISPAVNNARNKGNVIYLDPQSFSADEFVLE